MGKRPEGDQEQEPRSPSSRRRSRRVRTLAEQQRLAALIIDGEAALDGYSIIDNGLRLDVIDRITAYLTAAGFIRPETPAEFAERITTSGDSQPIVTPHLGWRARRRDVGGAPIDTRQLRVR